MWLQVATSLFRPSKLPGDDPGTESRLGANVRSSRLASRDLGSSGDAVKKKRKKKKKKEAGDGDDKVVNESKIDVIPIFCAVTIASILGGPVCLVANLKLGMFAAIGGCIMGYTTGRMFSDFGYVQSFMCNVSLRILCREQETIIKGEYAEVCGHRFGDLRKQRRMRRIEEYEKFLMNCRIVRERMELERENRMQERKRRRNTVVELKRSSPDYVLKTRARSLSYIDVLQSGDYTADGCSRQDRFSMPPVVCHTSSRNLQDR